MQPRSPGPGLIQLRDQLTRVVTELRLSIFDLRSGVSNSVGLGSVLGDYVREVGKTSGMTVHCRSRKVLDDCASMWRPSSSASAKRR